MRVQFFPERLLSCQKPWYMGWEIVEENPDVLFYWNYTGVYFSNFNPNPEYKIVINQHCLNTSKSHVDRILEEVFGYSSQAWAGIGVRKPNLTNGSKECELILLKDLSMKGDFFYQIPFIDDLSGNEVRIVEERLVIMNGTPVMTIIKIKEVSSDDLIGKVIGYGYTDIPHDKRIQIEKYCQLFGLDYGEIDAIEYDGRYYIFDVNPTPGDAMFRNPAMPEYLRNQILEDYKRHFEEWLT